MTRTTAKRAIATKDSIANLWAMAELNGEVTIRVDSEHAATVIRQRLYRYRTMLRKQSAAHLGIETSAYDHYTFRIEPETSDDHTPTGKYILTITSNDIVSFEILIDEDLGESIPDSCHFDVGDDLTPQFEDPPADLTDVPF